MFTGVDGRRRRGDARLSVHIAAGPVGTATLCGAEAWRGSQQFHILYYDY